jgi:hypothetical protein
MLLNHGLKRVDDLLGRLKVRLSHGDNLVMGTGTWVWVPVFMAIFLQLLLSAKHDEPV